MTPDYERAALKATETLIKYNIRHAPVDPYDILQKLDNVLVLSFSEMSDFLGVDRHRLISTFGLTNQDAVTSVYDVDGKRHYLIAYNKQLSFALHQRAMARELGHIMLGHDGTLPDEVRTAEARFFAHHLMCPRPLLKAVQDSGITFTVELLGNLTGCYEHCLSCMRQHPGVHIPPELNRQVRAQFDDYIKDFLNIEILLSMEDLSRLADFGTYMEGYEE